MANWPRRAEDSRVEFGLTEEQELLQKTAAAFVARYCPPEQAKAWDEAGVFPHGLWEQMRDLDWFSLPFSAECGGGAGGPMELIILAEELGRSSLDVAMAYTGTFIPGLSLQKWGSPEQWARWGTGLLNGDGRFAIAISEPDAGSDAAAMRTTAVDTGDHFVVNGQKMWCTGAGVPGSMIAMYVRTGAGAPRDGALSLLVVDPQSPGVE